MPTLAILKDQFNDGTYFEGLTVYRSEYSSTVELLKNYYVDAQLNRWEEENLDGDIPEGFSAKALEDSITFSISGKERTYNKFEDFGAAIELIELTELEAEVFISKVGLSFGQWPEW